MTYPGITQGKVGSFIEWQSFHNNYSHIIHKLLQQVIQVTMKEHNNTVKRACSSAHEPIDGSTVMPACSVVHLRDVTTSSTRTKIRSLHRSLNADFFKRAIITGAGMCRFIICAVQII